jgi:hypothetical protein
MNIPSRLTGERLQAIALVDAENQTIWNGRRLAPEVASDVFDEIDFYVVGLRTTVALAPSLLAPYVSLLACRGWSIDLTPVGPDAADLALLDRARFAITRGCTDLVIVSGDHIFAELAQHARLHVVSHSDRLSHALAASATSVSYLTSGSAAPMAA